MCIRDRHGVDKVGMEEKDMGKKLGRFTMTQFLSCADPLPMQIPL